MLKGRTLYLLHRTTGFKAELVPGWFESYEDAVKAMDKQPDVETATYRIFPAKIGRECKAKEE